MGVKKDFIDAATDTIARMLPEYKADDIKGIITRITKERLADPTITMDNNVTKDNGMITLTGLCSWIEKRQPVIAGNATFYMQPTELLSPTSNMLRALKKERKSIKDQMWLAEGYEYMRLDLDQGNKKVIMNAEYGGSGTPTAAFYTPYSPPATTLMAQSIITVMAAFFEGYIGDRQLFFNINECFDWMNVVVSKDQKLPKWIYIPSVQETCRRIRNHLFTADINDFPFIDSYISNLTETQRTYLFYANNLKGIISHNPHVQKIIANILNSLPLYEAAFDGKVPTEFADKFESVKKFNEWISKEMFLNPYVEPECIVEDMKKLRAILGQFVYVEYITPDSIEKLNNHLRNTVVLVDTDSNVLNSDLFVSFILDEIFPGETFNRPRMYNDMILVNVLASMLSDSVAKILDFYGRCHNMDANSRKELTMKNEFMFRRLFLMKTKKRYAASIVLREGNIMVPFKLEIKGMDFIKAGVTTEVEKKFTDMIKTRVLYSEDLQLHELMDDMKAFEKEIRHNLRHGGTKYLKPQTYKPEESYKKDGDKSGAWKIQPFKGATVWNELYPNNRIYSLDKVKLIKTTVTGPLDIDRIRNKYPDMYNAIMTKIFNSAVPEIRKTGLKVIAIPSNLEKIPEWLIELIDYDVTISDVIGSFKSVIDALKVEPMEFKTPNGKANITSCLISL